jgi:hypothetical protein
MKILFFLLIFSFSPFIRGKQEHLHQRSIFLSFFFFLFFFFACCSELRIGRDAKPGTTINA